MKKLLFVVIALLVGLNVHAKKVLKAGTIVPMQAVKAVAAADVMVGQTVDFKVVNNISVDGTVVIPQGTLVKGKVVLAKRSTIAGTKGRLTIEINNIILESGQQVYLSNTAAMVTGQNRTPLAVVAACFVWPCIFIPGTKAEMPGGYEVQGIVASNTEIE